MEGLWLLNLFMYSIVILILRFYLRDDEKRKVITESGVFVDQLDKRSVSWLVLCKLNNSWGHQRGGILNWENFFIRCAYSIFWISDSLGSVQPIVGVAISGVVVLSSKGRWTSQKEQPTKNKPIRHNPPRPLHHLLLPSTDIVWLSTCLDYLGSWTVGYMKLWQNKHCHFQFAFSYDASRQY